MRNVQWTMLVTMALTKSRSKLFRCPVQRTTNILRRYAEVIRGANAYIPPGARKSGSVEDAPKPDIPKVSINGPDGTNPTLHSSISNGTTPTPSIVSTTMLHRNSDTQFGRSPPVMPSFLLSVTSSAARNRDSPKRSKPFSGPNGTSGPQISSSSVKHSRLVSGHDLSVLE